MRANDSAKRESNITAKQPLMVRPSAPRFMNFGDKIDLPVVVQNQTDKDMAVDVAVRATNATNGPSVSGLQATSKASGKRVVVKANDRAEVRFPVSAVKAGTARFQIAVTFGQVQRRGRDLAARLDAGDDRSVCDLRHDRPERRDHPAGADAGRCLSRNSADWKSRPRSTQLQELTDAFIYLTNYPYACSEQISSRMISIAAMRDVLTAFKAKDMPTPAELEGIFRTRYRDSAIAAARRRQFRSLETRQGALRISVPDRPRRARSGACQSERLQGAGRDAQQDEALSEECRKAF